MDVVVHELVIFLMYAACIAHPTLSVLITLTFDEACKLLILHYALFYSYLFSLVLGTFFQTASVASFRVKNKFRADARHHV
jgi:hypothetical protein